MSVKLEVNGRAFDAIDTKLLMLGSEVRGFAAAKYGFSRAHTNNYAVGNDEPYNYSMGKKDYDDDASLTLYMEEVVAIEDATKGDKDFTKIKPFKAYFTYLNDAGRVVVDEVIWKFKDWGREVAVEGGGEAKEYGMHIIGINLNIAA